MERCPHCSQPVPAGARFCSACGSPLATPEAADEERKLVSVLFADVTGSTALGEQLDAERLRAILAEYFAAMEETVRAWGGTVEKFIGDAVVAAFGVPAVREDDADRALSAGLEMLVRLERLNAGFHQRHGIELAIRIGVNTGEVIAPVGQPAGQLIVAGDAVNVAARLQAAAEPGTVFAGERTFLAARNRFAFDEPVRLELKGKREPVVARRVLAPLDEPVRGVPGLSASLVGRDRELTIIETLLDEAIEQREPRLALIYGPAGIGKSRLTAELVNRSRGRTAPPAILRGRCVAAGHGVTYWALGEILRAASGIGLDEPASSAAARLAQVVGERLEPLGLPPDEVQRTTEALAATAGIAIPNSAIERLPPNEVADELGMAWPRFVTALASRQPLILVLEDLHWAGELLISMLQRLLDRSSGPILFVATARPEFAEAQGGFAAGREDTTVVALRPLTQEQSSELVARLLDVDALPAELREQILERADGNPFFLEELVRRLIDEGVIEFDGARWRANAGAASVTLPDTIHALLAARIDGLPVAEKLVLQAAAVVGRTFWPGPLVAVSSAGDPAGALSRLEQRGLIVARPVSTVAGQPEYSFRHALIRDVAYASLPRARRAVAHARVAEWSEGLAGDRRAEFAELVAFHYRQAVAGEDADLAWFAEPDRREALRRKAFLALLEAGTAARHRNAIARAIELDESALELATDDDERAQAYEALGEDHTADYHGDRAVEAFQEALRRLPDEERDRRARLALGIAHIAVGRAGTFHVPPAPDYLESVIDDGLELASDRDVRARLLSLKGAMGALRLSREGRDLVDPDTRVRMAEEAMQLAEASGDRETMRWTSTNLGELYEVFGDYEGSLRIARRQLERLDGTESRSALVSTLFMIAQAELDVGGSAVRAIELLEQAHELSGPLSAHERMHVTGTLARALFATARWSELEPVIEEHLRLFPEEAGVTCGAVRAGPLVGQLVAAWRGDRAAAAAMAALAPPLASGPGWTEGIAALAAVALGDLTAALEIAAPAAAIKEHWRSADARQATMAALAGLGRWPDLRRLIDETRPLWPGHPILSPVLDRAEGGLLAATGDRSGGVALIERALSSFGRLGYALEEAVTHEWLADAVDRPEVARAHREAALATYEQLGATAAAERVRRLLVTLPSEA